MRLRNGSNGKSIKDDLYVIWLRPRQLSTPQRIGYLTGIVFLVIMSPLVGRAGQGSWEKLWIRIAAFVVWLFVMSVVLYCLRDRKFPSA